MKEALAGLDPSMKPVIDLWLERFSSREIGEALGIPMGTACSRIRKVQLHAKRPVNRKAA